MKSDSRHAPSACSVRVAFMDPQFPVFRHLSVGFAMEIGGFQVQPTLRPEDVVVAGIEPVWLVVLVVVVVVNEVEMIRKSKLDARCVFVFTFISLYPILHTFAFTSRR